MRRKIHTMIFLMLICFLPFKLFAAPKFDQVIMLGDSLSDTGRIYEVFSNAHKVIPLIPVIPKNPPYFLGRFSNGPVWIEGVASSLNLKLVNYALGGSWAESFFESGVVFPWSFETMLDNYLTENLLDNNKAKHLYVLWGGGNDYLNNRKNVDDATTKTVQSLKRQIDKLIFFGVKSIIVLNLPDIGQAPYATKQGSDAAVNLSRLAQMHNAKFGKMIADEKRRYAGKVDILLIDIYYKFADILINPAQYHIKDARHACYTGGYTLTESPAVRAIKEKMNFNILNNASLSTAYLTGSAFTSDMCSNPEEFLFWDAVHPTHAAHQIISEYVIDEMKRNGWV